MYKWLAPAVIALGLMGCEDANWHSTDISEAMPPLDFQLVDENGNAVDAEDYQGKTNLLFFGFTHCPDVCPTSLAKLTAATRQIDEELRDDIQVLFISVDPSRDTPEVMKQYTDAFGPQFIGLTGEKANIDAVANRYRVTYEYGDKDAQGNYDVSHTSAIFAFDHDGNARLLMRESDPMDSMVADLTRLAEEG